MGTLVLMMIVFGLLVGVDLWRFAVMSGHLMLFHLWDVRLHLALLDNSRWLSGLCEGFVLLVGRLGFQKLKVLHEALDETAHLVMPDDTGVQV